MVKQTAHPLPDDIAGSLPAVGHRRKGDHMLWTIAVILIVLWVLGLVSNATMGGFIHLLLVIAIIVVLVGFIGGRRR